MRLPSIQDKSTDGSESSMASEAEDNAFIIQIQIDKRFEAR